MRWYSVIHAVTNVALAGLERTVRTAKEIGHGNTLEGQMMGREMSRLRTAVSEMRALAARGGPDDVLPRWRGEIRRAILLLPSDDVIPRMSMHELGVLAERIDGIRALAKRYSASRMAEILGQSARPK